MTTLFFWSHKDAECRHKMSTRVADCLLWF
jgi:hypothetical protein